MWLKGSTPYGRARCTTVRATSLPRPGYYCQNQSNKRRKEKARKILHSPSKTSGRSAFSPGSTKISACFAEAPRDKRSAQVMRQSRETEMHAVRACTVVGTTLLAADDKAPTPQNNNKKNSLFYRLAPFHPSLSHGVKQYILALTLELQIFQC